MPTSPISNRQMFWRILRRLFTANPARLFVILLALGSGAGITAALLNLQVDAKRRLTTEFRAFGPNVLILPKASSPSPVATLPESTTRSIPRDLPGGGRVAVSSALYLVAAVSAQPSGKSLSAVLAGINPLAFLRGVAVAPSALATSPSAPARVSGHECLVGTRLAEQLGAQQDRELIISNGEYREICEVASFQETGGPEDDRIMVGLRTAQRLADLPGRISAIELTIPGTPSEIQAYVQNLRQLLPDGEVRPIRQFTEGQAKIYNRISGLLTFTVALVLVLTALCVMAAMTNVAMERRTDVGLMKSIGGATRRILRLFLAEAALLGLAAGALGAAAGMALSIALGKAVFGMAARPRLIVYPISVALTILVALASSYPLRRLGAVRPASIFRGAA
jgi:putative ABC transport system permease protein